MVTWINVSKKFMYFIDFSALLVMSVVFTVNPWCLSETVASRRENAARCFEDIRCIINRGKGTYSKNSAEDNVKR